MKIIIKDVIKPVNVIETVQDLRIGHLEIEGDLTEVQEVLELLGLNEKR